MNVIETQIKVLERNLRIIKLQTGGLSDADSLIQPPFRGNCMNWIIGHILYFRSRILQTLGDSFHWSDTVVRLYQRESEPITEAAEGILQLSLLLRDLEGIQEPLIARLRQATPEELARVVGEFGSVEEIVCRLVWHETYHLGQLEQLRQLAGTNDKVI
jgi:hypothetical protein